MDKPNRRAILTGALIGGAVPAVAAVATGKANGIFDNRPILAMIAYPGMFPLDLVGPEAVFSGMGTHKVEIIWKDKEPVKSDSGLAIMPTMTFAEAPKKIDILFVPGGALGTVKCMQDKEVIEFLQSRAKDASLVTSAVSYTHLDVYKRQDICEAAKISTPVLYIYYASKELLVMDILSEFLEQFMVKKGDATGFDLSLIHI